MLQHVAGPYGADSRDHVTSCRENHDIGEREREREERRNESMVLNTSSLLCRGTERNMSREINGLFFLKSPLFCYI